jgi:hypothetical protein
MNWFGLLLGITTLFVVGLGFFWVIRGERFFGLLWWPYVIGLGLLLIGASLFVTSSWGSALLGVLGASLVWGATELKEQAIRAELGWAPFRSKKIEPPFANTIKKWRTPKL